MNDGRLSIRLAPQYQAWIAALPGDDATAVRAMMALGAAVLGFAGASDEALRLLTGRLDRDQLRWILNLSDTCPTNVRQVSDTTAAPPMRPVPTLADLHLPDDEEDTDPFASLGIDV